MSRPPQYLVLVHDTTNAAVIRALRAQGLRASEPDVDGLDSAGCLLIDEPLWRSVDQARLHEAIGAFRISSGRSFRTSDASDSGPEGTGS
jgi:hypothetical protein